MKGRDAYHSDAKWRRRKLMLRVVGVIVVAALVTGIFAMLKYL
jgi:hypothetical protein